VRHSLRRVWLVCCFLFAATLTVAVVASRRQVHVDQFIIEHGAPLLVAKAARIEQRDSGNRAVISARVLVIEGVRAWDNAGDPSPDSVLIYSDDDFVQTYVKIFLSNLGIEHGRRTFALGVRARIICVEIDALGLVHRQAVHRVPFIELAPISPLKTP